MLSNANLRQILETNSPIDLLNMINIENVDDLTVKIILRTLSGSLSALNDELRVSDIAEPATEIGGKS